MDAIHALPPQSNTDGATRTTSSAAASHVVGQRSIRFVSICSSISSSRPEVNPNQSPSADIDLDHRLNDEASSSNHHHQIHHHITSCCSRSSSLRSSCSLPLQLSLLTT